MADILGLPACPDAQRHRSPPMPSPFYILLGVANIVVIFVLMRLAQLYYAPKRLKDEAKN
jgi:hypothetical protein